MLATFIFSLLFVLLAIGILLWVKTPYYRIETCNVVALLELVVSGQATDSDWSVFSGMPIPANAYLESIRQRCLDIEEREYRGDLHAPYLFSSAGIEELRLLLREVSQELHQQSDRSQ